MDTPELTLPELIDLVERGRESRSRIDEYLVNGYLLITPEQYDRIIADCTEREMMSYLLTGRQGPYSHMPGIPVLIIYPGQAARDLGNGWLAVNFSGTIYAFDTARAKWNGIIR